MANDALDLILRLNLALGAAIIVVLALRFHVRLWFGARVAYALWLLPLVAAAMCFVPARIVHVVLEEPLLSAGGAPAAAAAHEPWLLWGWGIGAIVSLAVLALRQLRFTRALGRLQPRKDLGAQVASAESAAHGPAVIGVLAPVIVTPSDFEQRFDAEERAIVLAHERAHLAQGDPWINAAVLAVQCLAWFNPFVHLGARALRVDQELACDAAVLAQGEGVRRRYAEAMLKSHFAAAAPLSCAWPASDLAAFKERISMLKRNLPSRAQTLAGVSAIALVTAIAAAAAWAAQPARVVTTFMPPDASEPAELLAEQDDLTGLAGLDDASYLEALDDLDELEALADDGVLEGGQHIYINGRRVENRDLTPEERAELRQSLREARDALRDINVEPLSAAEREAIRAEMESSREDIARARVEMREAMREMQEHGLSPEEEAEVREALREAQAELEASAVERERAIAEAQAEVREARVELVRARLEGAREAREALREARAEIAREAAAARRRGDLEEQLALEEAQRELEEELDRQRDDGN